MNAEKTVARLVGTEETKGRRAELLTELVKVYTEGGPQAVTNEINRRAEMLAGSFAQQLEGLKKQL
jgi:hypothetical protein